MSCKSRYMNEADIGGRMLEKNKNKNKRKSAHGKSLISHFVRFYVDFIFIGSYKSFRCVIKIERIAEAWPTATFIISINPRPDHQFVVRLPFICIQNAAFEWVRFTIVRHLFVFMDSIKTIRGTIKWPELYSRPRYYDVKSDYLIRFVYRICVSEGWIYLCKFLFMFLYTSLLLSAQLKWPTVNES